ncbi:unnamed protein product, partial [Nesidiocoris tenuis]
MEGTIFIRNSADDRLNIGTMIPDFVNALISSDILRIKAGAATSDLGILGLVLAHNQKGTQGERCCSLVFFNTITNVK